MHMKLARLFLSSLALLVIELAPPTAISSAQEIDPITSLKMADGWQLVQANCTECHSAQIIVQNSGSSAVWLSRLRWMQETQGMDDLAEATEQQIVIYLATNYGPKASTRRPNLAAHLLPVYLLPVIPNED